MGDKVLYSIFLSPSDLHNLDSLATINGSSVPHEADRAIRKYSPVLKNLKEYERRAQERKGEVLGATMAGQPIPPESSQIWLRPVDLQPGSAKLTIIGFDKSLLNLLKLAATYDGHTTDGNIRLAFKLMFDAEIHADPEKFQGLLEAAPKRRKIAVDKLLGATH